MKKRAKIENLNEGLWCVRKGLKDPSPTLAI